MQIMSSNVPIGISYRPKEHDYLPAVVGAIRRHLGDWPIALLTEKQYLPPDAWLRRYKVQTITGWAHTPKANKVLRLWEHHYVFAQHFDRWIWWHDDMLLLRPIDDPAWEFDQPRIAKRQRRRPNEELSNWHNWLWDTLNFFRCQNIYAPNPVLHVPRLIERQVLDSIPENWNRKRLLFEPTYLLWHWHQQGAKPELAKDFRKSVFKGDVPAVDGLADEGYTMLNWGRGINHDSAREQFGRHYPLDFAAAD